MIVTEVAAVAPDVKRFRLQREDGGVLPPFSGGAHVIVEMDDEGQHRSNSYSLTSSFTQLAYYEIHVLRLDGGRGGSRFMHDRVNAGARLRVSHPVNLFPLARRARKHLLVAGGIGITPFLAMADQLFRERADFELHYAVRSLAAGAFVDELTSRYEGRVFVYPSDQGKRLSFESFLKYQPLGAHLYICGPNRMIEAGLSEARQLGWPSPNLHQEHFSAPAIGSPYQIRLFKSNLIVEVGAQQSMLEAIEAAGVDAPYMCRGGACGQCETAVLEFEGTLLHADHFLSEAEKRSGAKIMPCVSRFAGDTLVLDL